VCAAFTGFCPIGNTLRLFGFTPMLGANTPSRWGLYFMQTDRWYLERRIYLAVGINISVASVLVLAHSAWWMSFIVFCRRRDGVVRGDRLLHHGEHAVRTWRRTAVETRSRAFGALRPLRHVARLCEQPSSHAGLKRFSARLQCCIRGAAGTQRPCQFSLPDQPVVTSFRTILAPAACMLRPSRWSALQTKSQSKFAEAETEI
jgi:hypothetical protein